MQKCLDQGLGTLKKQGGLVYVWICEQGKVRW